MQCSMIIIDQSSMHLGRLQLVYIQSDMLEMLKALNQSHLVKIITILERFLIVFNMKLIVHTHMQEIIQH